jgi:hypothetical protein
MRVKIKILGSNLHEGEMYKFKLDYMQWVGVGRLIKVGPIYSLIDGLMDYNMVSVRSITKMIKNTELTSLRQTANPFGNIAILGG